MDDEEEQNLDAEYNRFLQIMKPYLDQLLNQGAIEICNSWIQRLSSCSQNEKTLRNKYIFALCYQLSKGVLEDPFVYKPDSGELPSLSCKIGNDESSSEVEYINIELDDTKIIYKNKLNSASTVGNSFGDSGITVQSQQETDSEKYFIDNKIPDQNIIHIQQMDFKDNVYQAKVNNLIMKLREIKQQNLRLHKELYTLKEESKIRRAFENSCNEIFKIDTSTSAYLLAQESSTMMESLKCRLREVQESRNMLIETINELKIKLDNYEDMKKYEIDDIQAKHRLEIMHIESMLRDEIKVNYEKELADLKLQYDESINTFQNTKSKEIENVISSKDEIISQKERIIEVKDAEISQLKTQIEDLKSNQHLSNLKSERAAELEKYLSKLEKSKIKYCRAYEAKLVNIKREKHLADCSLHLQLVKQRAEVINELTDKHQMEISNVLDKLENKYKEIVANVQATAVQRRVQDQMALESIIKTVCDYPKENPYQNPQVSIPPKVLRSQINDNCNIDFPSQSKRIGSVVVGNNFTNRGNGFSIDDNMGELFEKAHIPQRDLDGA